MIFINDTNRFYRLVVAALTQSLTWFIQVLSAWQVLYLDVTQVSSLGVDDGFGELILKSLHVLSTCYTLFALGEHADNAIASEKRDMVKQNDKLQIV